MRIRANARSLGSIATLIFAALPLVAADAVVPANGPKPVGPYTPGVATKDFLYVSGQGARRPDGVAAASMEASYAQCFENVKAIVEAGGLTMEHVVYMQVYLDDVSPIR